MELDIIPLLALGLQRSGGGSRQVDSIKFTSLATNQSRRGNCGSASLEALGAECLEDLIRFLNKNWKDGSKAHGHPMRITPAMDFLNGKETILLN